MLIESGELPNERLASPRTPNCIKQDEELCCLFIGQVVHDASGALAVGVGQDRGILEERARVRQDQCHAVCDFYEEVGIGELRKILSCSRTHVVWAIPFEGSRWPLPRRP